MIFSGAATKHINLSPDGKYLLVSAETPRDPKTYQFYHDLYLVDVSVIPQQRGIIRPEQQGVFDGNGNSLTPLAKSIKTWIPRMAWAPASDRIAFATQGTLAAGDVFVVDIDTGELKNLTSNVFIPSANIDPASGAPMGGGKFGDPFRSVFWSEDGGTIYALHGSNMYNKAYEPEKEWEFGIWKIDSRSGETVKLTRSSDIEFHYILNASGVANQVVGRGGLIVTARADDKNFLFEVNTKTGALSPLAEFPGNAFTAFPAKISAAIRNGRVAFLNEQVNAPEEIQIFDMEDRWLYTATSENAVFGDNISHSRQTITWSVEDGIEKKGVLYVPNTATAERPAPLIVSVYAGAGFSKRANDAFSGRTDNLIKPLESLLRSGYAILEPDFPIVGGGESCNAIGRHTVASLDVAQSLPTIDSDRAVAFGVSHGGWSVNCMLTRTDRFDAGVSIAGLSNLMSMRFSYAAGRVFARQGGQTAINKAIWDDPVSFWNESPIGRAIDINTPLLLIHGKEDTTVPFEQSVEMYIALKDLEKPVTLVGYDGDDHVTILENPDYRPRIVDWIAEHVGLP